MPTLDETLDFLITCLENPKFKSYGDIMKSKFQHSKPEEDRELRKDLYKGTKAVSSSNPNNVVENQKKAYKKKSKEERKKIKEKAAKTRANWYKDPKNYAKFKESLRKRNSKK